MSPSVRRRLSATCTVIGTLCLLLALPIAYLDRNVFQAKGFADNAAATLQDDAVRARLASDVTGRIVARDPRLVSLAPILDGTVDSLLKTRRAAGLVRGAAIQTHNTLFSTTEGSVFIDLANVGVVAIEFLRLRDPALAEKLERPRAIVLSIADRTIAVELADLAQSVAFLAFVLPLLALVLLGAGLLLAALRRRAALNIGLAIFTTGAVSFVLYLVARAVILAGERGDQRDVVSGVLDAFLGGFPLWCLAVSLTGAIVAGSAASVVGELDPARDPGTPLAADHDAGALDLARRARRRGARRHRAARDRRSDRRADARGGRLRRLARVRRCRHAAAPPRRPRARGRRSCRRCGRCGAGRSPWILGDARARRADGGRAHARRRTGAPGRRPRSPPAPGCNGSDELCARRFDQVTLADEPQRDGDGAGRCSSTRTTGISLERQLDLGIRGLQIDAYLGQRNDQGVVRTDLAPKAVEAAEAKIGPEGWPRPSASPARWRSARWRAPSSSTSATSSASSARVEGVDTLRQIRDWMDRNPREVLIDRRRGRGADRGHQGGVRGQRPRRLCERLPAALRRAVPDARADDRLAASGCSSWPRSTATRRAGTTVPTRSWRRRRSRSRRSRSCAATARAGRTAVRSDAPLFLVNHWVESYPPDPRDADVVNQLPFLVDRARRCARDPRSHGEPARGRLRRARRRRGRRRGPERRASPAAEQLRFGLIRPPAALHWRCTSDGRLRAPGGTSNEVSVRRRWDSPVLPPKGNESRRKHRESAAGERSRGRWT